ncbi:MAG: C-terminal helicase domain-containing protein, partial [Alphaproteobacteria bacterium]|nr:C-terminal helicase domain-containing protein [Alphaproteobacteria bacterium]
AALEDKTRVFMQTNIYRFCGQALDIVSRTFYNGRLQATPDAPSTEMKWIKVDGQVAIDNHKSKYNEAEIAQVVMLVKGIEPQSIGIITSYRAQAERLSKKLNASHAQVLTVDSCQGREFDVVIVSLVDADSFFVNNRERLNVSFTRAKRANYIIGSVPSKPGPLQDVYSAIDKQGGAQSPRNQAFHNFKKKSHRK